MMMKPVMMEMPLIPTRAQMTVRKRSVVMELLAQESCATTETRTKKMAAPYSVRLQTVVMEKSLKAKNVTTEI
jgi:hypothetical protein